MRETETEKTEIATANDRTQTAYRNLRTAQKEYRDAQADRTSLLKHYGRKPAGSDKPF